MSFWSVLQFFAIFVIFREDSNRNTFLNWFLNRYNTQSGSVVLNKTPVPIAFAWNACIFINSLSIFRSTTAVPNLVHTHMHPSCDNRKGTPHMRTEGQCLQFAIIGFSSHMHISLSPSHSNFKIILGSPSPQPLALHPGVQWSWAGSRNPFTI